MRKLLVSGFALASLGFVGVVGEAQALPGAVIPGLGQQSTSQVIHVQYRGRGGVRGGGNRGGGRGIGVGAGIAGLAAGAIIGGAIANANRGYYYQSPGYYGDPVYDAAPAGDEAYCVQRFRSYDPASGTYLGYDGLRHPCP